jgi:Biotin-protein ligase, N terminal
MKPKIALFIHQPKCSVQSSNGVMAALDSYYSFKIFTKHELEKDFFDDVDMICIPGGLGDADSFDSLLKLHKKRIQTFISRGGKYLGICMGAYWADYNYLNILDATRVDQYIIQPNTDTKRPHAKNMPVVWKKNPMNMYFYDGCTYTGNNFNTIAEYSTGYPMAIIQNNIGLIGCHPESEKHWYDSYSWMRKHWHHGQHKELLLDFVNDLMPR